MAVFTGQLVSGDHTALHSRGTHYRGQGTPLTWRLQQINKYSKKRSNVFEIFLMYMQTYGLPMFGKHSLYSFITILSYGLWFVFSRVPRVLLVTMVQQLSLYPNKESASNSTDHITNSSQTNLSFRPSNGSALGLCVWGAWSSNGSVLEYALSSYSSSDILG